MRAASWPMCAPIDLHGGQRRFHVRGEVRIAEPAHGQVLRDAQAARQRFDDDALRKLV